MDIHQRLTKNIEKIVNLRKTTFEKLAVEIGKDKAHLSRIMAGKKKANLDLVQKIADELGVDVQTLFKP
jgi:transcriptional regulator with XRE-family HTH domain